MFRSIMICGTVFGNMPFMAVIAVYSLLGFLVGLLVGRHWLTRGAGPAGMPRRQRDNGNRRQQSAPSTGGDGQIEIYAGNLSYEMTEQELGKLFKEFGAVTSARIITNRFNGKSKGYGFVEMGNRGEAQNAMSSLNGRDVCGRRIVVNEAKNDGRNE
jgi:hypothetical protein